MNPDGVTVNFFDNDPNGKPIEWKYASYKSIREELIRVVKSGKYLEKIWHDGEGHTKTEFRYTLSPKVFK